MKMNVALELEKGRQTIEDWRKIYLSKEGKFYRCYNESAFLLKNYVCTEEMQRERGDARPLQAKRYVSRKGEYVMVGFPEESLSKHVPSYGNAEMLDTNDMVLTVSEEVVSSDNSVEMMQTAYEDWRNSLEVHVPDQTSSATVKNGGSSKPDMARSGLFAIFSEIIFYPLESTTPAQNTEFISLLKQKLSHLL
jgi:hypothetical protein